MSPVNDISTPLNRLAIPGICDSKKGIRRYSEKKGMFLSIFNASIKIQDCWVSKGSVCRFLKEHQKDLSLSSKKKLPNWFTSESKVKRLLKQLIQIGIKNSSPPSIVRVLESPKKEPLSPEVEIAVSHFTAPAVQAVGVLQRFQEIKEISKTLRRQMGNRWLFKQSESKIAFFLDVGYSKDKIESSMTGGLVAHEPEVLKKLPVVHGCHELVEEEVACLIQDRFGEDGKYQKRRESSNKSFIEQLMEKYKAAYNLPAKEGFQALALQVCLTKWADHYRCYRKALSLEEVKGEKNLREALLAIIQQDFKGLIPDEGALKILEFFFTEKSKPKVSEFLLDETLLFLLPYGLGKIDRQNFHEFPEGFLERVKGRFKNHFGVEMRAQEIEKCFKIYKKNFIELLTFVPKEDEDKEIVFTEVNSPESYESLKDKVLGAYTFFLKVMLKRDFPLEHEKVRHLREDQIEASLKKDFKRIGLRLPPSLPPCASFVKGHRRTRAKCIR